MGRSVKWPAGAKGLEMRHILMGNAHEWFVFDQL